MLDLDPEQQLFIVQHLATYHTHAQVKKLFKEAYGLDLSSQVISSYNPATLAGQRIGEHLKAAFADAREAFQAAAADLAITHRNFRRRCLQELLDDPNIRRNPKAVMEILKLYEQIEGGMFSRAKQEDDRATALEDLRRFLGVSTDRSSEDADGQREGA